jgi:hypothetical protein
MKLRTLFMIAVLLGLPGQSQAQTEPTCDPAAIIAKASALKSSDKDTDLKALEALAQEISATTFICNRGVVTGEGDKVIEPLSLNPALYKLVLKAKGSFIVNAKAINKADCPLPNTSVLSVYADTTDTSIRTTEAVFDLSEATTQCRIVFSTELSHGEQWSLSIVEIK